MIGVWVAVAAVAATGAAIVWWRVWSPRIEQRQAVVAAVRALEAARLQELFDLPEYIPEHERR